MSKSNITLAVKLVRKRSFFIIKPIIVEEIVIFMISIITVCLQKPGLPRQWKPIKRLNWNNRFQHFQIRPIKCPVQSNEMAPSFDFSRVNLHAETLIVQRGKAFEFSMKMLFQYTYNPEMEFQLRNVQLLRQWTDSELDNLFTDTVSITTNNCFEPGTWLAGFENVRIYCFRWFLNSL